ncbi:MAG TPA: hypothetical protein VLE91_02110 [Candidatus Saccharimonadales bacterium]|nr:hypothetical protein [Candidatus Saccharimonadales bacterium]
MLLGYFQKLRYFLPLAVLITGMCALVYGAVQQDERQRANDPQIEISENIATYLKSGQNPATLNLGQPIDISKSLSPFVMVFDANGKLVMSSAQLNGKDPNFPQGVLDSAKAKGQSRVTWMPQTDARAATITTYYKDKTEGYVTAGRSLREVEKREQLLQLQTMLAWLVTMGATFLATMIFVPTPSKPQRTSTRKKS